MKKNKDLLAIHLNEFNFNYLKYGVKKYRCKNIKKILNLKKISTYTEDKTQDKDLDPWVQSVSINSGKKSYSHKIYKLGQKIPNHLTQIWDVLSKKNISCTIWGAMNASLKKNKKIEIFFPDPWNYYSVPYPNNLKYLFMLPRYYAKNYLDWKFTKIFLNLLFFIYGCFKNQIILFFFKNLTITTRSFFTVGLKNFVLFFLFDLFALSLLFKKLQKKKSDFSLIFLNSIAHYQHNNWDEINKEKLSFLFIDKICNKLLQLSKLYSSTIIFNGFTQKKINIEYLIRPINPEKFLKKFIKFEKLEQDMTSGGFIFFKNKVEMNYAYRKLMKANVCGIKIFQIEKKGKNSIFYKIIIKGIKKIKNEDIDNLSKKILLNSFAYIDFKKVKLKNLNIDHEKLKNFLKEVKFIKVTGIHVNTGEFFYDNFKINNKKKKINNSQIFNLIKGHFKYC